MIRRLVVEQVDILEEDDSYSSICIMAGKTGYEVLMPNECVEAIKEKLMARLVDDGYPIIETYHRPTEVSEDLYGFSTQYKYKLFTMYLEISGVGPKTAMSLISDITWDEVQEAVNSDNKKVFTKASGVGGRTAESILDSMKHQLGK